ncbi:MAG: riboflavin synthase [Acidimicrobiia bacterium]
MFTGIVEELGSVRAATPNEGGARLEISCKAVLSDAQLGSSIAVNGCCLTVVAMGDDWWTADAQRESLDRTTLGGLEAGDPVNLERPVRLSGRLGGHLVQGHVDAVGTVSAIDPEDDGSTRLTVTAGETLLRYVVEKGSITVDGVSLTVASLDDSSFSVALIPHTLAVTTLGTRRAGDGVNLEVDVLAKYVERLLTGPVRSDS